MTDSIKKLVRSAMYLAKALLLLLVVMQFAVVVLRYIFGANFLWAQEAALMAHGAIFMLAAGWTLICGKHVAIDVASSRLPAEKRSVIAGIGFALFTLPMIIAILITSVPYALDAWRVLEGSQEVSGLPGVFLFKSIIPVFALLMLIAGLVMAFSKSHRPE